MPGFSGLKDEERSALIDYLLGGEGKEMASSGPEPPAMRYRSLGITGFWIRMDIQRSRRPGVR